MKKFLFLNMKLVSVAESMMTLACDTRSLTRYASVRRFQMVILVRIAGGTPSSITCLTAFQQHWVAWAGKTKRIVLEPRSKMPIGCKVRANILSQWREKSLAGKFLAYEFFFFCGLFTASRNNSGGLGSCFNALPRPDRDGFFMK